MNINYLYKIMKYSKSLKRFRLEDPAYIYDSTLDLSEYTVQKDEEMRLDLIIESIYGDISYYEYADILLYINGIDNPLNIRVGQKIYYPNLNNFEDLLVSPAETMTSDLVKMAFSNFEKVKKEDPTRKSFVENNYSLPPVVSKSSKNPVSVDNGLIKVGGIN